MNRGEVFWATFEQPVGRRPVVVATRGDALPVLTSIAVVPITRTIRGIASEVLIGKREGLPASSVANCDGLITVPVTRLDDRPVGRLKRAKVRDLDDAIRFALGCSC